MRGEGETLMIDLIHLPWGVERVIMREVVREEGERGERDLETVEMMGEM